MLKHLVVAIGLLSSLSAFAEKIPLMRVTAQAYPGEEYFIGVEVDSARHLTGIYYEDRFQANKEDWIHSFAYSDLTQGVVLKKKDKYELIKLRLTAESNSEYSIDLDFMTNGMFNYRGHAYLTLKKGKNGGYELFYQGNEETKAAPELVNNAYIATRFIPLTKKQLGIGRIDFSYR